MAIQRLLPILVCTLSAMLISATGTQQPNIVFIVADDLGWNDIGWHNPKILSPILDKLASEGVKLNNYYVQSVCSPSRSAFMSGYYPYHTGMHHYVMEPMQPTGLPLNLTILPQRLKKLGYATHIVGKWHLGFCKWEYTPTYRGFDTFYGYFGGVNNYYTHYHGSWGQYRSYSGLDFRNNTKSVFNQYGVYSAFSYANRAIEIIQQHNSSAPMFLYLPFQSVHGPLQVPKEYLKLYPNVKAKQRRTYMAMVSALDTAVGQIVKALKQGNMMDNTLLVFTTDNGGSVNTAGNNWPLRGSKHNFFEGGTRGIGFAHGKMLKHPGVSYEGLMHAVDWLPTFVEAAGGAPDSSIDGRSQYKNLIGNLPTGRGDIIYNVDQIDVKAAIKKGKYKLIIGDPLSPMFPKQGGWFPPPEGVRRLDTSSENLFFEMDPRSSLRRPLFGFNVTVQLYDLSKDPTEHHDVSTDNPDVVDDLYRVLLEQIKWVAPARFPPETQRADPKYFDKIWTPGWC